jgi:hypothetical protein
MPTLAYARLAFKSLSRSARHIYQLIASHQNRDTGWAYLGYGCLANESSLTPRRVMQLVAVLEASHALEVRRGHGRGHTNFYRVLDELTGEPVSTRTTKKVKSGADSGREKVKFPTPPAPEKVKSDSSNLPESLINIIGKVVEAKEKKDKEAPIDFTSEKPERCNPFWCEAHGFAHSERLPDRRPECRVEQCPLVRFDE